MNDERAIYAGEKALESLYEAKEVLSNAKTWGLIDLFFGKGGFSGFMKHSNVDRARRTLEAARNDLMDFRNELSYLPRINIEIDGFLTFADFFFDGFVVDLIVQSRINSTLRQIDDAIDKTKRALDSLRLV